MTNKARIMFFVGLLVSFFIGYIIAACLWTDRLTIDEYQLCERIALDIYEQKEDALISIPKEIFVQISDNEIIVRKNNCYGLVKGIIEGETVRFERYKELGQSITFNSLSGLFMVIVFIIFCATGYRRKE